MSQQDDQHSLDALDVPQPHSPRIQRLMRVMALLNTLREEVLAHRTEIPAGRPSAQGKSGKHVPLLVLDQAAILEQALLLPEAERKRIRDNAVPARAMLNDAKAKKRGTQRHHEHLKALAADEQAQVQADLDRTHLENQVLRGGRLDRGKGA